MAVIRRIRNAVSGRVFTARKNLVRRLVTGSPARTTPEAFAADLNVTQRLFVRWNAERLGLSEEESLRRYQHSWDVVAGGHRGIGFEIFMFLNQEIFSVFFGNRPQELFDTYRFHGYRDLLRQMIFPEPAFTDDHPVVAALAGRNEVTILDFGCGLAQRSRFLAKHLRSRGVAARVVLADIPSVESEFLEWVGANTDEDLTFLACSREEPIPPLPACDVVIATELFEHVDDPLGYFERFDEKLVSGGILWTDVADHEEGFLHLTPRLAPLREELARRGYQAIERHILYRKS